MPSDPAVVVKRVKNGFPGPNIIEWNIWHAIIGTSLEPIFGRCLTISWSGKYLMMERLNDLNQSDLANVPQVPDWLTDRKRSAFGKDTEGSIKIRDYAGVKLTDMLERWP